MGRRRHVRSVWILGVWLLVGRPVPAHASATPLWSVDELAGFSHLIVSGQVLDVSSRWDPGAGAIYTYATVGVAEVFKGTLDGSAVTVKQLGGLVGDIALAVADQATFTSGEQVLLFLESRPRDRTLYTAALWQGKWTLVMPPDGMPGAARGGERVTLDAVRAAVARRASGPDWNAVDARPRASSTSLPFTLMGIPYRYTYFPPVDVQAGGQPGLAGGGFAEVNTAVGSWNGAGAAFRFLPGSPAGPRRCANQFLGNYRVTISFADPCGEISDFGGTLAIAGSYFTTAAGVTVNGTFFRLALEGFVINNDSPLALQFLQVSGCFQDVQLHELGHVLGLGHSTDPAAVMFPTINRNCATTPAALAADDVQGLHFVYPVAAGTPGKPIVSSASAVGEVLTIQWFGGPGAAPTAHRLDFFAAGVPVASVTVGPDSIVGLPIGTSVQGVFSVQVTPFTGAAAGPPSDPFVFAIGSPCLTAPLSPAPAGGVVAGTATVNWIPVAGATSYVVQAGTSLGAADLLPPTAIGTTTGVTASQLPPGFSAWLRVTAVNACGASAPADVLVR